MNYYEMLEVSRDASEEVIRAAYKAQTAKYHPDNVISGDESKMKEINLAYETLSDPVLRAEYDKKLENEEKNVVEDDNVWKQSDELKKQNQDEQDIVESDKLGWYVSIIFILIMLYLCAPIAIILYVVRIVQIIRKPHLLKRKRKIFSTVMVAVVIGILGYIGATADSTENPVSQQANENTQESEAEKNEEIAGAQEEEVELSETEVKEKVDEPSETEADESTGQEQPLVYALEEIVQSVEKYSYFENPYYIKGLENYVEYCNAVYEEAGSTQKVVVENLDAILKEAGLSRSMRKKIAALEGTSVLTDQNVVRIEEKEDSKILFSKGSYYEVSALAKEDLQPTNELLYDAIYYIGDLKKNKPDGEGAMFFLSDNGTQLLYAGQFKEGRIDGEGAVFSGKGLGNTVVEIADYKNNLKDGNVIEYNTSDEVALCEFYMNAWDEYIELYFDGYDRDTQNKILADLFTRDPLALGTFMKICYSTIEEPDLFTIQLNYPVIRSIISYQGEMKNGKYDGKGTLYGRLGTLWYEGELKEGKRNGKGILYYALTNTVEYEGDFRNNTFDGKGTLYNEDGTVRKKGKFAGDEPDQEYEALELHDIVGVITEVYENKGVQNYFENNEASEITDGEDEFYEDEY